MKVLITAHTADEHGIHYPGDEIELGAEEARQYVEKQWGLIVAPAKADDAVEAAADDAVETAAVTGAPETATGRRQRK